MKKQLALILILSLSVSAFAEDDSQQESEADEIVVTAPSSARGGRRAAIYTPQQAVADALSESLTFVGRGIADPLKDENNNVIDDETVPRTCVFKNSKVYVVHHGCEAEAGVAPDILNVTVYRRNGQSIEFYAESTTNSGRYSIDSLGRGFRGSWKTTLKRTPGISREMNLESFFEYHVAQMQNTELGSCTYGTASGQGSLPIYVCVRMPKENSWRQPAEEFYLSPLTVRFREFHDAVKNASR